jgi:NTE family protein
MNTYRILVTFLSILLIMSGCQSRYEFEEDPAPLHLANPERPVRLALVLGAGGVRGLAHVGVLQELEDAGIQVDVIVGCSMGSIIGALYADCCCAQRVRDMIEPLRKWDLLDLNMFKCRYGLVQGGSLTRFLRRNLHSHDFCELQIPLYVVATDLRAGESVCMSHGKIIPAIKASSAYPFVFCPSLHFGRILVDGGVVDPVPVCIAEKLEADIIVAVDLCHLEKETCPTNLFGVLARCAEIQFFRQTEFCLNGAHIIIRPNLGDIGTFDDEYNEQIYQAGRVAGKNAIPAILKALELTQVGENE